MNKRNGTHKHFTWLKVEFAIFDFVYHDVCCYSMTFINAFVYVRLVKCCKQQRQLFKTEFFEYDENMILYRHRF